MKTIRAWLYAASALVVLTSATSSYGQAPATATTTPVAVRWEPDFRFPGTFFPSYAIAAAGRDPKDPVLVEHLYGFVNSGSLAVKVLSAPAGTKLKAQVEIPEIGVSGDIETVASDDGQPLTIIPRLSWSQRRLTAINQPVSSDAVFRLYADGALVSEERRPVRIRAINDAPLKACKSADHPERCTDYSPYLAAFVNEGNPAIDGVLRAALNIPAMPVKQWTGTQGTEEQTLRQVWAIWYLFQRNKVTYSSVTTVADQTPGLTSQEVRPFTQALRTQQANCIDGTALFASILRKIGIEPAIVLIPGHAFLAFSVNSQNTKDMFLETTMLNDAHNPFYATGPSKWGETLANMTGDDIHQRQSWTSFKEALQVGQAEYNKAAPNFGKAPGFKVVSIVKAREAGILPLPM
jgi:hypothetical protein